ncbi:hypothetical protein SAMN05444274_10194 [Mariniphaga anaerophila]|uniref:Uncharacterized protein n=1 Tax=Mariniphaga anaerophila TaxID=1484053 RepID=A0A1M4SNV5_9BACT|nr:hypothetical protein SAMN05444274_10194 [Mariniphaga anaerophila]
MKKQFWILPPILKNLTGIDGCGWITQLSDSTKLEPLYIDDLTSSQLTTNLYVFNFGRGKIWEVIA